jgi:malate dehydrogenase
MNNAPGLSSSQFTAMTRLDHNRAKAQLAARAGHPVADVTRMTIWGNHSATQYPDIFHASVAGVPAYEASGSDQEWLAGEFIPTVQQRGAAIIEARGLSSAASAANAAIDHMRDWVLGTNGKWVTMGIPSDGSYGIPKEVIYGYPVTCANGEYQIVQGLEIDSFSRERMDFTLKELMEEQDGVKHLLG